MVLELYSAAVATAERRSERSDSAVCRGEGPVTKLQQHLEDLTSELAAGALGCAVPHRAAEVLETEAA